uniref:U1-Liphistoxin-Lth1a_1 n=1 Tax=Liphistius thaleban TaxID=1905330 RepID=A0A4Q8K5F7_9ARAC
MNRRQSTRGVCRRSAQMNSLPLFVSLWMVVVASSRGSDSFVQRVKRQDGDICLLPPKTGPCRAVINRYYHSGNGICQSFIYGGCQGNGNNFRTKEECERVCSRRGHFRG